MTLAMKIACLAAYALGIAGLLGLIHGPLAAAAGIVSIALLGVHALELLYAFRFLHRHPGSMAASVALALLFGVLHWAPLARQAKSAQA
jgi:uncharacterized protein YhhL (DUF1145 family)